MLESESSKKDCGILHKNLKHFKTGYSKTRQKRYSSFLDGWRTSLVNYGHLTSEFPVAYTLMAFSNAINNKSQSAMRNEHLMSGRLASNCLKFLPVSNMMMCQSMGENPLRPSKDRTQSLKQWLTNQELALFLCILLFLKYYAPHLHSEHLPNPFALQVHKHKL